ncbi:hypothetical protein [Altererythrobacter sp.]|uniref:alpha/beta fold hydrolase n=1 Tax=Altererythrobacter sp. TaxID=1872480 RepID=UPI00257D2196|nr:hypothetical protein [Altererythrobacter sp.]
MNGGQITIEGAGGLRLPLHLIRGGSSDLVSEEAVAHLRGLVPRAEYTDIAEATHMVMGDLNDVLSTTILKFFKRHHQTLETGS